MAKKLVSLATEKRRALRALRLNANCFAKLPLTLRKDPEVIEAALLNFWSGRSIIFEAIPYALRQDPTRVNTALHSGHIHSLKQLKKEYRNDLYIVQKIVSKNGLELEYASPQLKKDPKIVLAAMSSNGFALQYAHKTLRNNPDIVREAILRHGDALLYASKRIQNMADIVSKAIRYNSSALQYASERLKRNKKFITEVVQINGLCLEYAAAPLKKDFSIALKACTNNGGALRFVDPSIQTHPDIIAAALSSAGHALGYLPKEYKKDKATILLAFSSQLWWENTETVYLMHKKFRQDREVMFAACKCHGWSLRAAHRTLKNDPELVLLSIQDDPYVMKHASPQLKQDIHFLYQCFLVHPETFQFAHEDIKRKCKSTDPTAIKSFLEKEMLLSKQPTLKDIPPAL